METLEGVTVLTVCAADLEWVCPLWPMCVAVVVIESHCEKQFLFVLVMAYHSGVRGLAGTMSQCCRAEPGASLVR